MASVKRFYENKYNSTQRPLVAAGEHVNSWILSRNTDVRLTAASERSMSCDLFQTTDVFNLLKFSTGRNIF